jgi:hypothetical protein
VNIHLNKMEIYRIILHVGGLIKAINQWNDEQLVSKDQEKSQKTIDRIIFICAFDCGFQEFNGWLFELMW